MRANTQCNWQPGFETIAGGPRCSPLAAMADISQGTGEREGGGMCNCPTGSFVTESTLGTWGHGGASVQPFVLILFASNGVD